MPNCIVVTCITLSNLLITLKTMQSYCRIKIIEITVKNGIVDQSDGMKDAKDGMRETIKGFVYITAGKNTEA